MKTFAIAAAVLGLACTTTPAFAGEREKMSLEVELSDINLGTASGQKLLDQRIERAVRTVCRVTDVKTGTRIINRDARACLAKARADAREQVAALTGDKQRGG
ncbi:UrcA family protein [Erythrobacter sp. sf7]|uniref:UrcA family protein n=1 Tax=Erythrobacter fulvus TaxID=2987523 RepID=A0ABT5JNL5_9SPHN|nr:UrcA family protein [Erythrobacter fulvus]MDC8753686.1 UrcA family protein [Erythrobacter fulvus]